MPKTTADEVVEKHLEWMKGKGVAKDQGNGEKVDPVNPDPDPDLELVFGEGATELSREWEKEGIGSKWPDSGEDWEKEGSEPKNQSQEERR